MHINTQLLSHSACAERCKNRIGYFIARASGHVAVTQYWEAQTFSGDMRNKGGLWEHDSYTILLLSVFEGVSYMTHCASSYINYLHYIKKQHFWEGTVSSIYRRINSHTGLHKWASPDSSALPGEEAKRHQSAHPVHVTAANTAFYTVYVLFIKNFSFPTGTDKR